MINSPNYIVWTIFIIMVIIPFFYKIWCLFFKKKDTNNDDSNKTQINYKVVFAILYFLKHLLMVNTEDHTNFDDLTRFSVGLYATSLFALFYSITIEKKHEKSLESTMNTFNSSITHVGDEVEKLRENQPKIYPKNDAKEPNKELFIKLSREIFEKEKFTYEGENAVNASMCLTAINMSATERQDKTIFVNMIMKRPIHLASKTNPRNSLPTQKPENDQKVIDLFTTLLILYYLKKSKNLTFRIYIYKNNYREQPKLPYCQFVNLTENSLFFSPHKKTNTGGFPHTFNFKNTGADDCFYKQFKNYMTDRLEEDFDNSTKQDLTNVEDFMVLFKFFDFESFAKSNYFEGKFKSFNYNKLTAYETNQVETYFRNRISEREKIYNKLIKSVHLS